MYTSIITDSFICKQYLMLQLGLWFSTKHFLLFLNHIPTFPTFSTYKNETEVCMYVQGVHCLGEKLKVGSRNYKST